MLFKQSPEKFWNLIANKYAASPISDSVAYEKKIEKIKNYLAPDSLVLDIGCATGTQCCDLASKAKHVTGIDISEKLMAIAERRKSERGLENVEFRQTNLWDAAFQEESFNMVMAFHVLHFIEDIDGIFSQIHKILKPGGIFISETSCLAERNKVVGKLLRFAGKLGLFPLINLLSIEQLEQSLIRAGFTLIDKVKSRSESDIYTLFAKKS